MNVFSLAIVETRSASYVINVTGVEYFGPTIHAELITFWSLGIVIALACTVSIITIFLYKNRRLQITLCKFNLLLYLGFIFTGFYCGDYAVSYISKMGLEAELNHKLGAILPIFSAILVFLATRAVKKDEDLVRSADRIR